MDDARIIQAHSWPLDADMLIFDEIPKMKGWKRYVKGVFDNRAAGQPGPVADREYPTGHLPADRGVSCRPLFSLPSQSRLCPGAPGLDETTRGPVPVKPAGRFPGILPLRFGHGGRTLAQSVLHRPRSGGHPGVQPYTRGENDQVAAGDAAGAGGIAAVLYVPGRGSAGGPEHDPTR